MGVGKQSAMHYRNTAAFLLFKQDEDKLEVRRVTNP